MNFRKFGIEDDPEDALDPQTAFNILTVGMFQGSFTGKKLKDYIDGNKEDYRSARKIINRLDKATLIESYAKDFEKILTASKTKSPFAKLADDEINLELPNSTAAPLRDEPTSSAGIGVAHPNAIKSEQEPATNAAADNSEGTHAKGVSASVEITAQGGIKADTSSGPSNNVVVEKKEGWLARKWKQLLALVTGNSLLDGWSERFAQIQALGLPERFWRNLIYFTIGGAAIYFAFDWYKDYQDRKITGKLIAANSTATNMVQVASTETIQSYAKDKDWQIINVTSEKKPLWVRIKAVFTGT